jgi:hypothetical protein
MAYPSLPGVLTMNIRFWTALTCTLLLTLSAAGCSTDAICTEACNAWESKCSYSDYDFDVCFDDCKFEADWSQTYADCVTAAGNCGIVEDCDPFDF